MINIPIARLDYTAIGARRVSTVCLSLGSFEVGVRGNDGAWEIERFDTREEARDFHITQVGRAVIATGAPAVEMTREEDRAR